MFIGMDLGNAITKVGVEGRYFSFDSAIDELSNSNWRKPEMIVDFKGVSTVVGEGVIEIENKKSDKTSTIPLVLAGLGRALGELKNASVYLAVGLPIGQFKENKDYFREYLKYELCGDSKDKKTCEFTFNGVDKKVVIEDIYVFAEGLGAFVALNVDKGVMLDVGSKTTEMFLFDRGVVNPLTEYKGVLDIYKAIATDLSNKLYCDFEIEEIPNIIKAGYVLNYGEKIDISDSLEEAKKIVKKIYTRLNLNYQISKYPVYLTGGGAYFFGEILKENNIPDLIVNEDLFLNVKGYEKILMDRVNKALFNS